jgi:hypothetical protein
MLLEEFHRWQFAEVCEAANTDLGNVFQICSSNAFALASPPVSLKPPRLDHCWERETNPRPLLSHCERSSASRAGKKPSRFRRRSV